MTDEISKYIESESKDLKYGKIVVQLMGEMVDVITEKRKRFQLNKKDKSGTKKEFRNG